MTLTRRTAARPGRRWRVLLPAVALLATACASAPRGRAGPVDEEQKIWPAGPPPTTPGERGDVPSVPPVVKP